MLEGAGPDPGPSPRVPGAGSTASTDRACQNSQVVLGDKMGSDRQTVFPTSWHCQLLVPLSLADLLKGCLVEVLAYDPSSAAAGQPEDPTGAAASRAAGTTLRCWRRLPLVAAETRGSSDPPAGSSTAAMAGMRLGASLTGGLILMIERR